MVRIPGLFQRADTARSGGLSILQAEKAAPNHDGG